MPAILSAISMIQTALSVVGAFKGSPQVAKVTGAVQDAVSVVNALTPLVTQFAGGTDVTPADVRAALAGKDAALAEFDKAIVAAEAEQPKKP